jgi:glucosylglycerol 3-phosphatase
VQWQTRQGAVSHPGVRDEILNFLNTIPPKMTHCIREFFARQESTLDASTLDTCLNAAILDNKVSPTVNLNVFYDTLSDRPHLYQSLQKAIVQLTTDLLAEAKQQGLENTFFIHYAPNLGQDAQGNEMIQLAEGNDSGTTDFQFMLKGARKEVGLLFLLNQYYGHHQGHFPLGQDFHVLDAPQDHSALLQIIQDHFDPAVMPLIVGVGDTVTSKGEMINGELKFFRGGSDRGFLQLIQMMGEAFDSPNVTVYVDSSGGEVKNRKAIAVEFRDGQEIVVDGPTDNRDRSDPLRLNVVIPGGYVQYVSLFNKAAARRGYHSDRGKTTV